MEAAAQLVKADKGHGHSAFQKAMNPPSRVDRNCRKIHVPYCPGP